MQAVTRFRNDPRWLFVPVPIAVALAAALALLPTPAGGARKADWDDQLTAIEARLEEGRWKPVRKAAARLATDVATNAWSRADIDRLLAEACLYRAVAEINLGLDREAIWHWETALHLQPRLAERDLSAWSGATSLTEYRLRRAGRMPPGLTAPRDVDLLRLEAPELEVAGSAMIQNRAAPVGELVPDVRVEVVVARDGALRRPRVITDYAHPVVVYGILEWLLELPPGRAARLDGRAVDSLQTLIFSFDQAQSSLGLPFGCTPFGG